jgi:guanosine-3',5'-bis(diphosphate) 3'-pyrophosphohydrolase
MEPATDARRLVLEAASFAARAHHGQMRKDNTTPYVSHVFRVCLVVRDVFGFHDAATLTAALLHDTIEDTTTDFDDIEERFGRQIAAWVAALTKNKSLPEAEREQDYIQRLLQAPWQVQACKLADVYDNLTDLPRLPPERRGHSLERAEQYLQAIQQAAGSELREPLRLVMQLLQEMKTNQKL